ncbi:MAG: TIGR01620 family protein, partial [Mesorhizobium sp.]
MNPPRKPAAFRIEPEPAPRHEAPQKRGAEQPVRRPRAARADV